MTFRRTAIGPSNRLLTVLASAALMYYYCRYWAGKNTSRFGAVS